MAAPPSEHSLIQANERFYRTFEALDFPAMEKLWEESARVCCVHPGWPALHGARPVLSSWKGIMANTAAIGFDLVQVSARVEGNLGIVTLYERIYSTVDNERSNSGTVATNLFGYHGEERGWLIFHHHASPAVIPEDAEGEMLN